MTRRLGIITETHLNSIVPQESYTLLKFREKLAKNFIDILILKKLKTSGSLRGCSLKNFLRREFQIPIDRNLVYLLLYSLEENGLIKKDEKKYALTKKGEETIDTIIKANDKIQLFVRNVF
jgi:DNA-binding PadR family transcriptional regulator